MLRLTRFLLALLFIAIVSSIISPSVHAAYDPQSTPNNKFGIHILSPDELPVAAHLVNANGGDWGYAVIVIQSNDRNQQKWQQFMDHARKLHIIPIIRLATVSQNGAWAKPTPTDATDWAKFLSSLYWPTSNHYVILYNEPNHAAEWGNTIDPAGFAQEMQKTIQQLKAQDPNVFVLNPGFDAASPDTPNQYMDEQEFLTKMDQAVPGIFSEIDGWASHSYPQPNFSGSPDNSGRNTITTYRWEESVLQSQLHVSRQLPVFITETGWADTNLTEDQIANYYKTAYTQIWDDPNLIAVAPFTLSYQQAPFAQFSWLRKPIDQAAKVLGIATDDTSIFTKQYDTVAQLPKTMGKPIRASLAQIVGFDVPQETAPNQLVPTMITLKNIGETSWFADSQPLDVAFADRGNWQTETLTSTKAVDPGQTYTVQLSLLAPADAGVYPNKLAVTTGDQTMVTFPFHLSVVEDTPKMSMQQSVALFLSKVREKISS